MGLLDRHGKTDTASMRTIVLKDRKKANCKAPSAPTSKRVRPSTAML